MESLAKLITVSPEIFRSRLIDGLADVGYVVFPSLVRPEIVDEIRREMENSREAGDFVPAGIGKGSGTQIAPETRGDGTHWFEPSKLTPTQAKLAGIIDAVREQANSELFLGLWDWEGHYAIYPPGTFYRKHLDRFANDSRRTLSMVFFFNSNWEAADGGALRLESGEKTLEVLPNGGTAVFFLSAKVPHEVVETKRDRFSFAGWFRTRA